VPDRVPASAVPPRRAARAGHWAIVNRGDAAEVVNNYVAVSRRCRHQLADLSKGGVDASGCLVCPWHASRYDLDTGEMVSGPKGFLNYQGPTPGYTQLVQLIGRIARLRRRRVRQEGDDLVVD
jgi:nitrite reductase/ring-hydroxylating ferredoxin subunit